MAAFVDELGGDPAASSVRIARASRYARGACPELARVVALLFNRALARR